MIQWMDAFVGLAIGALLGILGTTALALKRRTRLEADLSNARAEAGLLAEQIRARDRDEARLKETFGSLGAEALRLNNAQFMDLASRTFDKLLAESRGDADKRQQAIDGIVRPVRELLERHDRTIRDLERSRQAAYGALEQQVKAIAESNERLNRTTDRLTTALRRPEQRGRWGEMQLRNVVQLAGMVEHCDFTEQPQTDDPSTRDRPDMIVHVPGGGVIVVDSKVALDAYLDAIEATGDARRAKLERHAEQVEKHARKLADKRYWEQFERTPKLVVMFMPLEAALVAALDLKPELHAGAMRSHVLIATPTLLVALLRSVAYGWQQDAVAENARRIARTGRELYDRLAKFVAHFERVGAGLRVAGDAYDQAVGSVERRLLPSARQLKELQATTEADVETPRPVKLDPRPVTSTELKPVGDAPVSVAGEVGRSGE